MCFWRPWGHCHTLSGAGPQRYQVVLFAVFFSSSSLLPPRSAVSALHVSCFSRDRQSPGSTFVGPPRTSLTHGNYQCAKSGPGSVLGWESLPPPLLGLLTVTSSHSLFNAPRLIFPKFTLESRSLCLQSLQWLPKICIMKLKPLASLYNSHSESGRGSFLELTCSSREHLRASHVTASPLAWSWFPRIRAVLLLPKSPPVKPTRLTNTHFFNTRLWHVLPVKLSWTFFPWGLCTPHSLTPRCLALLFPLPLWPGFYLHVPTSACLHPSLTRSFLITAVSPTPRTVPDTGHTSKAQQERT